MDSLFAEIKSNPGVFGSVICTEQGLVDHGDLPSMFRAAKLVAFAHTIRRLAILDQGDDGFHGMEFSYDQSMVVIRFITTSDLLITFCTPDVDVQLIHLQQNVLLPEFLNFLKERSNRPISPEPEVVQVKKKATLMFRGVAYGD